MRIIGNWNHISIYYKNTKKKKKKACGCKNKEKNKNTSLNLKMVKIIIFRIIQLLQQIYPHKKFHYKLKKKIFTKI